MLRIGGTAIFFRVKKSSQRAYLQIVENHRIGGTVRQSVIANLGRAEALIAPVHWPHCLLRAPSSLTRCCCCCWTLLAIRRGDAVVRPTSICFSRLAIPNSGAGHHRICQTRGDHVTSTA